MPVVRVDVADGARSASHNQAVAARAVCVVANTAKQFAVGNASSGKEHIVSAYKIIHGQHLAEVVSQGDSSILFVIVAG